MDRICSSIIRNNYYKIWRSLSFVTDRVPLFSHLSGRVFIESALLSRLASHSVSVTSIIPYHSWTHGLVTHPFLFFSLISSVLQAILHLQSLLKWTQKIMLWFGFPTSWVKLIQNFTISDCSNKFTWWWNSTGLFFIRSFYILTSVVRDLTLPNTFDLPSPPVKVRIFC